MQPLDAIVDDDSVYHRPRPTRLAGQGLERAPTTESANDPLPLFVAQRPRVFREDRRLRVLLIMFADRVKNGHRRAMEPLTNPAGDVLGTAGAGHQPPRAAQNLQPL